MLRQKYAICQISKQPSPGKTVSNQQLQQPETLPPKGYSVNYGCRHVVSQQTFAPIECGDDLRANRLGINMKRILPIGTAALLIAGCASNPDSIDSAYVSPLKYKDYDCDQIAQEMDYTGQRTTRLYQRLKDERTSDNWQMGVGLLVFWPALFFLEGGDGPEAAEYSQLKGEFEALRQASVQKKCGIDRQSPEEIIKQAQESDGKDSPVGSEATSATEATDGASKSQEERLRELKALFDDGLISEEVYLARQREILAD